MKFIFKTKSKADARLMMDSPKLLSSINGFFSKVRTEIKHSDHSEEFLNGVQFAKEAMLEELQDNNINLEVYE